MYYIIAWDNMGQVVTHEINSEGEKLQCWDHYVNLPCCSKVVCYNRTTKEMTASYNLAYGRF